MKKMIIAIDGPSGSGKGTLAKKLAERLGFSYLDTGLLYRAVGNKMIHGNIDLLDPTRAEITALTLKPEDFANEELLRNEVVAAAASTVAAYPEVRNALLEFQRAFAKNPPQGELGSVLDGRDIGTVVCVDADVKLFITASLEERARRRLKELQMRGIDCIYETILEDVKARDERDTRRDVSPLKPSADARIIDTSELTVDDVFEQALEYVYAKKHELEIRSSAS